MTAADRVRTAWKKLGTRRARAAFVVTSMALSLVVPVAILTLRDGVIESFARAAGVGWMSRRAIEVVKTPPDMWWHRLEMDESDREKIGGVVGVERVDDPRRLVDVRLVIDGQEASSLDELHPGFAAEIVGSPGAFAEKEGVVPLIVGRIFLVYEGGRRRRGRRREVDPDSYIGREVEFTVGDPLRYLQDDADAEPRRIQEERIRASMSVEFDLTKYDFALELRGRIVGVHPGHEIYVPTEAFDRIERWRLERDAAARIRGEPLVIDRPTEYDELLVLAQAEDEVPAITERLEALGYRTDSAYASRREAVKRVRIAILIAYGLSAVLFAASAMVLVNLVGRAVADSRQEIGVLRAVGASEADVRGIYLAESLLVGLLGSALAWVLGNVAGWGVSEWALGELRRTADYVWVADLRFEVEMIDLLPATLYEFEPQTLLVPLGALALCLAAGWWPARRAARMDPVDALRAE